LATITDLSPALLMIRSPLQPFSATTPWARAHPGRTEGSGVAKVHPWIWILPEEAQPGPADRHLSSAMVISEMVNGSLVGDPKLAHPATWCGAEKTINGVPARGEEMKRKAFQPIRARGR
jgi:hypothetical protein